jgi:hypothetical protein
VEIEQLLGDHLAQFRAAPFLFVGSGLSRRYLGLESWESLLRRSAGLTDRPYAYSSSSAGGSLPAVATAIAERFHEQWWTADGFAASRDEFADIATDPSSALKIEISRHIRAQSAARVGDPDLASELDELRNAVIDGVVTTNWDLLIERLFDQCQPYVGQDELIFHEPAGIGEIYKIHGCCSQPNSLVLTTADYQHFEARNPYLAAKLLAIFVEHPVVFLGYSLSDRNIVHILHSIATCLTSENLGRLQDRLVFVHWTRDAEPRLERSQIVLDDMIVPIVSVTVPDYREVFAALRGLERKSSERLPRRLNENVSRLLDEAGIQPRS